MSAARAFYLERAVHHGGMAAYYAENIRAFMLTLPTYESDLTWALAKIVEEATEAWHYALLLNPEQIHLGLNPPVEPPEL